MFKIDTLKRITIGLTGIFMIAFGVILQIKANFGLDALNALYSNLSAITPLTIGNYSIILGFFFILFNKFASKQRFNYSALAVAFTIGIVIDWVVRLFSDAFIYSDYTMNLVLFIVGVIIYGMGIALLIFSKLPSPLEELQFGLRSIFKMSIAGSKTATDLSLLFAAATVGFVSNIGLGAISIGTILITVSIGKIIEFSLNMLNRVTTNTTPSFQQE